MMPSHFLEAVVDLFHYNNLSNHLATGYNSKLCKSILYIFDSHCSFYLSPHINCCTIYGPPGAARALRANVKPAHLKVKGCFVQTHDRGGWNPSRERSRAVDCLWEFCMEMFLRLQGS